MIISQVLQSEKNRQNPQQRLVAAMSCIDVAVSLLWFFTNFFVPPWSEEVAWASGNESSCSAQGFIVQLSIGAVLYNTSLSLYYLLVIRYGFSEARIRKFEKWMHIMPLVFGFGTAITAVCLNLYNPANWDCWIAPYPADCRQSYTLWGTDEVTNCERGDNATIFQWAFFFGPLWVAILTVSVFMAAVFRFVRAQDMRMKRYEFRARRNSKPNHRSSNTRQVASQSALYVGAFFITWIFPTISRLVQLCGGDVPMWLVFLSGCFIPFQGFFNALVYFRLRFFKCGKENDNRSKLWIVGHIMRLTLCCCVGERERFSNHQDGKDIESNLREGRKLSFLHFRSSITSSNRGSWLGFRGSFKHVQEPLFEDILRNTDVGPGTDQSTEASSHISNQFHEGDLFAESDFNPEVKQEPQKSTIEMILESSDRSSSVNLKEEVVEEVVRRSSILNLEMGTLAAIYEDNLDDW